MSIQVWFATLIWAGVMGLAFTASAYLNSTLNRKFESFFGYGHGGGIGIPALRSELWINGLILILHKQ